MQPLPNKLTVLVSLCPAAPSIVPIMHQISSTMNSFTLSWPQPEQPNGIILDYELRFYEKVRAVSVLSLLFFFYCFFVIILSDSERCLALTAIVTFLKICTPLSNLPLPHPAQVDNFSLTAFTLSLPLFFGVCRLLQ